MPAKKRILDTYLREIYKAGQNISASDQDGKKMPANKALDSVVSMVRNVQTSGKKVIFVGNGGSASIASHQAVDFWKNGRVKALSFNDHAVLTCIANDYGYEHVFEKPVECFSERNDLLIAISSSGRSQNILNAVEMALLHGVKAVTLSGFSGRNPLRKKGHINFYVPSGSYGIVEISHLMICHSILDHIIDRRD